MVTYHIYIVAIDKETGKAFVKRIEVPYTKEPESYLMNEGIEYVDWGHSYDRLLETANNNINLLGKVMKCKQCGKYYYISHSNIYWYKANKMNVPKRCRACRNANREKKLAE